MGLWDYGTVGLWDCGTMGLWDYGTMGLWDRGTVGPWDCETVGLWDCGTVGLWLAKNNWPGNQASDSRMMAHRRVGRIFLSFAFFAASRETT